MLGISAACAWWRVIGCVAGLDGKGSAPHSVPSTQLKLKTPQRVNIWSVRLLQARATLWTAGSCAVSVVQQLASLESNDVTAAAEQRAAAAIVGRGPPAVRLHRCDRTTRERRHWQHTNGEWHQHDLHCSATRSPTPCCIRDTQATAQSLGSARVQRSHERHAPRHCTHITTPTLPATPSTVLRCPRWRSTVLALPRSTALL